MPNHKLHTVTPAVKAAFLEALAETANVRRAAAQVGFSARIRSIHARRDPEFAARWDETMQTAVETVFEAEAIRRAVEGVEKGVYFQGQQVGVHREYSDTLLIFLLKGWRPERYKDRSEVMHAGSVALLKKLERIGTMTPEELAAFLQEAEAYTNGLAQEGRP
jgi:hypothetical protein